MSITARVSVYGWESQALNPPIQQAIARLQTAGLIAESGLNLPRFSGWQQEQGQYSPQQIADMFVDMVSGLCPH